jgi:hypothetical protein
MILKYCFENGSIKQMFSPAETKAMRFYATGLPSTGHLPPATRHRPPATRHSAHAG